MSKGLFQKETRPQALLNLACNTRILQEDGSRSLRGDAGLGQRWENIIAHYIVGEEHPEIKIKAVSKVLHLKQNWTVSEFEAEYLKEISIITAREKCTEYIVAFPILAHSSLLDQLPELRSERITFQKPGASKVAQTIFQERHLQREAIENKKYFENQLAFQEHVIATCRCDAFSVAHAQAVSERNIEYIVGLAIFLSNYTDAQIVNGLPRPISNILIAPHITVHKRNGKIATEVFWFEPWAPHYISAPSTPPKMFKKNFDFLYLAIRNSPWNKECVDALRLYFKALQESDRTNAFLGLWRVLEKIGGDDRTSSDKLIYRAAFFYESAEEMQIKGRYFKDIRNSLTHAQNNHIYESHDIALSFKEFIRPLFNHFLANYLNFTSKEEFWSFCSIEVRPEKLRGLAETINKAIKFRRLSKD